MSTTHRIAAATATALIALTGLAAPTSAAPATASAAAGTAPNSYTTRVDMDGDRRPDKVTLAITRKTADRTYYSINVVTAKGKKSSARLSVDVYSTLAPAKMWAGSGAMDGAPGSEIRVLEGDGGESFWLKVYTWRNGKLALQREPRRGLNGWAHEQGSFPNVSGYTFSTVRGVRQVVSHDLVKDDDSGLFSGTDTTFQWVKGAWKRSSTTKVTSLPEAKARALSGWHGVRGMR